LADGFPTDATAVEGDDVEHDDRLSDGFSDDTR